MYSPPSSELPRLFLLYKNIKEYKQHCKSSVISDIIFRYFFSNGSTIRIIKYIIMVNIIRQINSTKRLSYRKTIKNDKMNFLRIISNGK